MNVVPKVIAHYELVKELGRGGMATVYEAIDLHRLEPVALKVLLPHFSSEDVVCKRFLREAQAGMTLDHPGIVKVYEVGEADGNSFIAMELVAGRTLDELIQKEPLSVEHALDIGLKVADALVCAHENKIIHRDLKPGNIMVSTGNVKVMDFGLVRVMEASSLTGKYEIVGTLHYMSPQQAIGAQIDERSDIFSLGVVLYQALTGVLPFEGDHPGAIIHAILHSDPLRIEELRKGVPVEVEQVVFKALQKLPQDRYQHAVDLKADLERVREILRGRTVELIATDEVFEERARGIYSVLVGRERELEMLEGYVKRMLRGEGRTVLVSGEAGIGKSRLVWELGRKEKGENVRYLVGRCLLGREGLPYQPVREIIRSYLELKGVREPDKVGDYIEKKAPHLKGRLDVIHAFLFMKGETGPSLISREQLWDTATELVRVMARDRPIMLHIEDLHWADLPTLHLLLYLSRNTRDERVLLVGTYRPEGLIETEGEGPHPLVTSLETMKREGLCDVIGLGRLDKEGTTGVIVSVFPHAHFPESFTHAIHEETEGNPLFILEVLQLLRDEGVIGREAGSWRLRGDIDKISIPGRVNDVITYRLRSLTREERKLVEVASVEGRAFQSDTLCRCLQLPRIQVLLSLQELEHSHHLIHASEREYHFDHVKVKDVIYEGLIPELRREYHRLIGEYYTESFGEKQEYAGKIAHHLLEADREQKGLPFLLRAGEHAKRLFANEESIGYFDKGLDVVDRYIDSTSDLRCIKHALLQGRAKVKQLIGRYDEARTDYMDIERLTQDTGDYRGLADALEGQGETFWRRGDYEAALACFEQALKIQQQIGDKRGEGSTLTHIGIVHWGRSTYEKALAYFESALEIQRQINDKRGVGSTLQNIGNVLGDRGAYEKSLAYYESALEIRRQIGDKRGEGSTLMHIGIVHGGRNDYEKALAYYGSALEIARQIGDKQGEAITLTNIGIVHGKRGTYKEALGFYESALDIKRQIGDKRGEGITLNNIGNVQRDRGAYDEALACYESALEIARQIGDKRGEGIAFGNKGNVHQECGAYKEALTCYQSALEIALQIGDKEGQWDSHHYLGTFWLDVGACDRAIESLEEAERVARALGTRRMCGFSLIDRSLSKLVVGSLGEAHQAIQKGLQIAVELQEVQAILDGLVVAARVEIERKNVAKAREFAERALTIASEKERMPDSAHAHLLLARIHFMTGDLSQSAFHANQAFEVAEACGMKEILWQAYHYLGKVLLKRGKHSKAQENLKAAQQLVTTISSDLSDELSRFYLVRTEVRGLYEDLRR
jgi:tetratricopeptide (TPR) repeat protein